MSQSRVSSALEALANVTISYLVSFSLQLFIFPMFGVYVPIEANLVLSGLITGIAIIRIYLLRRLFNYLALRQQHK